MATPKLRNANRLTRVRVGKLFLLPSRAKQNFKDECDINKIMAKYEKRGTIEHLNQHQGKYGDFIHAQDYHLSLNLLLAADDAFASIPSKIRAKFDNDPAIFLDFAQNPENLDQMISMGLAPSRPREPGTGDPGPDELSPPLDPPLPLPDPPAPEPAA